MSELKNDAPNPTGPDPGRLDSWKEIASHLGRSTRTVQRWEKEEGLPVYRRESPDAEEKPNQRQVFAYKSEIDAWWRRFAGESSAAEIGRSLPTSAPFSRTKHRLVIAALAVAIVGAVVWQIERGRPQAAGPGQALLQKLRDIKEPMFAVSPNREQVAIRLEDSSVWVESMDGSTAARRIANRLRGGLQWSPDGAALLLTGSLTEDNRCVTQILYLNSGASKDLWECGRDIPNVRAWHPSGDRLLTTRDIGDRRVSVALVEIESGEATELFQGQMPMTEWHFSPDGERIAYSAQREGNTDIFVRYISGGDEIRMTDHPDDDRGPVWSPDGRSILFFSPRGGSGLDLWSVPVARAGPAGRPNQIMPLGLQPGPLGAQPTMDGGVLYRRNAPTSQLALLPVHPATGAALGQESNDFRLDTKGPVWLDKGRTLEFGDGRSRVERDLVSGEERRVQTPIPAEVRIPAESNERGPLTFYGAGSDGVAGFYQLEPDGRDVRLVRKFTGRVNPPLTISPNGAELLFESPAPGERPPRFQILAVPLDGGEIREVAQSGSRAYARWSPNGAQIAYSDRGCLMTVSQAGGEARQLVCGPQVQGRELADAQFNRGHLSWSPDASKLAWTVNHLDRRAIDLWVVDVATGAHHVVWTGEGAYEVFPATPAWSPAGDQIAFVKEFQPRTEVWELSGLWPNARFGFPR